MIDKRITDDCSKIQRQNSANRQRYLRSWPQLRSWIFICLDFSKINRMRDQLNRLTNLPINAIIAC